MEILTEYGLEIFFGLVSAGLLAYCKHLWAQKQELAKRKEEDLTRLHRQMILDEIEPIIEELKRIKDNLQGSIDTLRREADHTHADMYKDLELVTKKNDKNLELIINSYKFRLIQLCKTHLRDGYISQDEFDQVTEMYKLYHGLGGNGQAQDYYERVMELEIREK
ncbi:MAG: hypothetical protein J6Q39_04840 [Bacteroidales bacterium]|nr:hypothetical protein [Bacteroidales bacterium]